MKQTWYLWVVAFVSGMSVMALEMSASRLVAPYFGTSLFVWANVIGMILAALAVGYWVGGKLADKAPRLRVLLGILGVAGLWALLIPLLVAPLARFVVLELLQTSGAGIIIVGSFAVLLVLFSVPITLMGMTSPFLIRLLAVQPQSLDPGTSSPHHVGQTAGGVFALSTVGSLLGTFLPVLVLIPWIGTRATVFLFAAILLATVAIGWFGARGATALVIFLALPAIMRFPVHAAPGQLAEKESAYQYIQVLEEDGVRVLRFNEALADQSAERADSPLSGRYWDTVLPLPNLSPAAKPRVLILGLAAGTIARGIVETRPPGAVSVTGVEIDPAVVEVGKQYFSLGRLQDHIEVVVEDARTFLERSSEKYDLILVDAYANQLYIPPHLATAEFYKLVHEHLAPGGVVVANINAPRPDSPLFVAMSATIGSAFPEVESYVVPDSWNRVIVASASSIDWEGAVSRVPEILQDIYRNVLTWRTPVNTTGRVLTDDRAPVELMTDAMIFDAFRQK